MLRFLEGGALYSALQIPNHLYVAQRSKLSVKNPILFVFASRLKKQFINVIFLMDTTFAFLHMARVYNKYTHMTGSFFSFF